MENSFYTEIELKTLGFAYIGENVLLSKKASFYSRENIVIGNNVRIDDFCILSGKIYLGDYIHIAAYTALYGGEAGIVIENYSAISSGGVVYAVSDDYSGVKMTNPMLPMDYRNVIQEKVCIGKHVIIGTGCTILPGVIIGEGVAVGAMSLVKESLDAWTIYAGIPCKKIRDRSQLAKSFEKDVSNPLDKNKSCSLTPPMNRMS